MVDMIVVGVILLKLSFDNNAVEKTKTKDGMIMTRMVTLEISQLSK